jgi:hypothetical protein
LWANIWESVIQVGRAIYTSAARIEK